MGWEGVKGGIKKDRDWSALCFYQSLALIVSLLLTTIFDPGPPWPWPPIILPPPGRFIGPFSLIYFLNMRTFFVGDEQAACHARFASTKLFPHALIKQVEFERFFCSGAEIKNNKG